MHPEHLKSAELLASCGLLLKFLIRGCLGEEHERAMSNFIDVLSHTWSKVHKDGEAELLASKCRSSLAEMELHFPGREMHCGHL